MGWSSPRDSEASIRMETGNVSFVLGSGGGSWARLSNPPRAVSNAAISVWKRILVDANRIRNTNPSHLDLLAVTGGFRKNSCCDRSCLFLHLFAGFVPA